MARLLTNPDYKVFVDNMFGRKSVVDAIFRAGGWSNRIAEAWRRDRATRKAPPDGEGGTASSRAAAAKKARRAAHGEMQRRDKYDHSWIVPGRCDNCTWDTQKKRAYRVKCYICKQCVCIMCSVEGHVLCINCRGLCKQTWGNMALLARPKGAAEPSSTKLRVASWQHGQFAPAP